MGPAIPGPARRLRVMNQTVPSQRGSRGPAGPPGRIADLEQRPTRAPQPPRLAAVRPCVGPRLIDAVDGTIAIVDLTALEFDELVPVGAADRFAPARAELGDFGQTDPPHRAPASPGAAHREEGTVERYEPTRSTRELVTGMPAAASEPGPPATDPVEPGTWPEVRFYLGSASLFFVTFILTTALWVVLPTVLLGWSPSAITSGSMEPAIRLGDVVVGNPDVPADLGPGTVITFDSDRGRITHRVVGTDAVGNYITRGDANEGADRVPVAPGEVRSVGRILVPFAGYPSVWTQSGSWWSMLLVAGGFAFLVVGSRWAVLPRFNPWLDVGPDGGRTPA